VPKNQAVIILMIPRQLQTAVINMIWCGLEDRHYIATSSITQRPFLRTIQSSSSEVQQVMRETDNSAPTKTKVYL